MKKTKSLIIAFAIVASVSTLLSFVDSERKSSSNAKLDQAIADWERAKAYTKAYLDASTDEVVNFKPTPEMRSFGEQMLHLAEANYGMTAAASGKTSPITRGALEKSDQYKTKAALTKAVMDSYDFVIAAAKEMDEQKLGEKIKMFDRFEMTREVGLIKAFEHQTHHRGQTTVYLRLKGLTPPQEMLF
ncbi:MAG TPA: DinB family protein [Chryseolinea sp.]